ncbi:Pr6Pr family membrane protein [Mycobacteroides abscessus]|uniref:Pr6Pr family membrane protein n=1 Tax=Mycobacteroides abscessus TaxID=36809 RepID=UPI000C258CCA|nr:Pr6Pr family membrane protein [Mycobacteroides abscessus]
MRAPGLFVSAAIAINQAIGVFCQFIQRTDRTFPLLYFTIDSAIFAGVVAVVALIRPARLLLPQLRTASAVGVLLSSLIFTTVIAPASSTGTWVQPYDDYWVRTATVLLHGVAPVLVIIDLVVNYAGRAITAASVIVWSYLWPMAYLVSLVALVSTGIATIPYPFLNPAQLGWRTVLGSLAGLCALILIIAWALLALAKIIHRIYRERSHEDQ